MLLLEKAGGLLSKNRNANLTMANTKSELTSLSGNQFLPSRKIASRTGK